jgi:hypothetical protein
MLNAIINIRRHDDVSMGCVFGEVFSMVWAMAQVVRKYIAK